MGCIKDDLYFWVQGVVWEYYLVLETETKHGWLQVKIAYATVTR
jgi:hypothetical protein